MNLNRHLRIPSIPSSTSLSSSSRSSSTDSISRNGGLHLHFGAGKLGLGLLLKAIESSDVSDYAIVQRPSASFQPLIASNINQVTVRVNGEQVGRPMTFLHGRKVSEATRTHGPFFIAAQGGKALLDVVRTATSFSCSLHKGLGGLKLILGRLPVRSNPPTLYAAENDHDAVEELARELAGRVSVVPCMVDRICSERIIDSDGSIDVRTEKWEGQIVVLPKITQPEIKIRKQNAHTFTDRETTDFDDESDMPTDLCPDESSASDSDHDTKNCSNPTKILPFAGSAVITTNTEEQAKYFSRRKILLVNGTHTTLAFLTLVKELDEGNDLKEMELPGPYKLLDYETIDQGSRRLVWAWLVARCVIVTQEFSKDVLMGAHGTESYQVALKELLQYAWTTLHRFSHVPDTTGRVLSGGVVKRFDGRLNNVLEKVNQLKQEGKFAPEEILIAASTILSSPRLTVQVLEESLEELVEDARPIREEKFARDSLDCACKNQTQTPSSRNQQQKEDKWSFLTSIRKVFFSPLSGENAEARNPN
mmetsp:Transcript_11313/g.15779  ORF Transcript_11313/g.15779 Transcript_11313/m.15779 type:complete len:534 (-) Transcript_11313:261-1862(-)|eukprot:CAMPEP_0184485762 /NCGR_PEP_ID=MMETSP0113_2-20130426/7340_1 /TAXON_ID=91329 /ORGANISM="Norrisiella sphaerica, Strain BC52" /LENGTH=533 /DNA_ID=CAMNT_0026867363 /DNA_START=84 /DNA_END=1685 /DNA_ORIENTATION=+